MRTTIVRMLRLGRFYNVKLGCGCAFQASADEAKRNQLFIGKAMTCETCGEERG